MRLYLPVTLAELNKAATGGLTPRVGYGLTQVVQDAWTGEDDEELTEAVILLAAGFALTELGEGRRAVIAADVLRADREPRPDVHPAAVEVTATIRPEAISCAFVDEPEARADAKAAATGDEAALERLEARDMLWYDVTELGHIA